MNAETVLFPAVPLAGSFAMDTGLPVPEDGAVALAAEVVGFLKGDRVAVGQPQPVPVVLIVAVQAPPLLAGMIEHP